MSTAVEIERQKDMAPRDAEELLRAYWSRHLAACPIPVDPFYLAERLDVDVALTSLDEDVAGALFKERGRDPVIFLNRTDGTQRRRFTLAHELGHFVSRTRLAATVPNPEDWGYIDLRSTLSREGRDPDEIYANTFAANLLMPTPRVVAAWDSGVRSTPELASLFDVSLMSIEIRIDSMRKRAELSE